MRKDGPSAKDSVPDPTALSGKELAKSRLTRRRILEAARDLLSDEGYSKFSTGAVAERALLTRPAMLYHFGSRMELLTAVVQFLVRRRIEMIEEDMAQIAQLQAAGCSSAVDVSWMRLDTPEVAAFAELMMAARTNSELKAVVEPAMAAFERARRAVVIPSVDDLPQDSEDFGLARDVARAIGGYLLLRHGIVEDRSGRVEALKRFLYMLVTTAAGRAFLKVVVAERKAAGLPAEGAALDGTHTPS